MHNSINFLRDFHPDRFWVLTAIHPSEEKIETETFSPEEADAAARWIEERDGASNLYFSVNPPGRAVKRKAKKKDITTAHYLHVDLDPRPGEDLDAERERIRKLLEGDDSAAFIIDSGGGFQAFWRLVEAVDVESEEGREQLESRNRALERRFGGDSCSNVDRLMRLPGTMNLPTRRKLSKGRTARRASVVRSNPHAAIALEDIKPAPSANGTRPKSGAVEIDTASVRRLGSVDELDQYGVPDRVKVVIVQGEDADYPKDGDNSRSAWLFDACCQLVRAGVPDEVIFSVVTDPSFDISSSVLEKSPRADQYALRQIERAKAFVVDPLLCEMNDRFFIVRNYGGKFTVFEPHARKPGEFLPNHSKMSDAEFKKGFAHRVVAVGENKTMELGLWWLKNPLARRYDRATFAPGLDVPEGVYNLWRGFAVEPKEGDWSLLRAHIRDNVCDGRDDLFEYLLNWMARCVQRPWEVGEVAVVMRGGRGVGKTIVAKQLGSLFGEHFLTVANSEHFTGKFNAHLEDCVVLLADEALYAGDKKHESVLKTLITDSTLPVERKFHDVHTSRNSVHLLMSSNSAWVVPAGLDERRFFVVDVSDARKQDNVYFGAIIAQMDAGGREAMLFDLLQRDIARWNHRAVPRTSALMQQQELSLGPTDRAVYEVLSDGWHPQVRSDGDRVFMPTEDFRKEWCPKAGPRAVGFALKAIADVDDRLTLEDGRKVRGYWLPPLHEARERWEDKTGLHGISWPEDVTAWIGTEPDRVF